MNLMGISKARISLIMVLVFVASLALPAMPAGEMAQTAGDVVEIPDENLEEAIRDQLGIPTGDITEEDMEGLTYLTASHEDIEELTGLEYAVNLERLSFWSNEISDINALSGLENLEVLRLSDNEISNLSALSGLENLQELELNNNVISELSELSGLESLEVLKLSDNEISELSALSGLVNLQRLELKSNEISDLSELSGLENLEVLRLSDNEISKISALSGLEKLQRLWLNSNKISDLGALSGLKNLRRLELNSNEISDLSALSELENLKMLVLGDNALKGQELFSELQQLASWESLTGLGLSNSDISDLEPLSGMDNFRSLFLDANEINDLSALSDLGNLLSLFLDDNEISDLSGVSDLENLETLSLSSNKIRDISALSDLAVGYLYLQENYIDISEGSEAMEIINELIEQGVYVEYEPQNTLRIETGRYSGAHRYETAVEISQASFPDQAEAVVLARGDDFPDALAGVPLAYAKGGPLLLARSDELPEETADEIDRLLTEGDSVYVLGGEAAVSEEVAEELDAMDYEVERLEGEGRFDTAVKIAEEITGNPEEVFLTTGLEFPDAVAASGPAAMKGAPILLTSPDELSEDTERYLADNEESIEDIHVIGGEAAVSDGVKEEAGGTDRVSGAGRWETGKAIAETFFEAPEKATLATGLEFPDALAGGVYAALNNAPVLLSARYKLPDEIKDYFTVEEFIKEVSVFGGDGAVSDNILWAIESIDFVGDRIEYGNELEMGGEIIKVLDEENQVIFEFFHEEFVDWAEDHWEEIFEEIPAFHEEYLVYPEDLNPFFDETASLSPCGTKFAFSIHDYYTATRMSFVGIVNLQNGEIDLVDQENRGKIDKFYWSPGEDYLSYALDAAEGERYFLSNDNVGQMTKEFTFSEEELREALNAGEYSYFHPDFRELSWREDGNRLEFTSNAPQEKEAEAIFWSVDPHGEDLTKEDM